MKIMAASRTRQCDEAERGALVLPLEHRVQRDCRADTRESDDHFEEAAEQHGVLAAGAEDEVAVWFLTWLYMPSVGIEMNVTT